MSARQIVFRLALGACAYALIALGALANEAGRRNHEFSAGGVSLESRASTMPPPAASVPAATAVR